MGVVAVAPELCRLDAVPTALLHAKAHELHDLLGGPTIIHLQGRDPRPLFASVLLHGNETTGWEAARQLLTRYRTAPLPRSLSLFIGNVVAAREGVRRLENQVDYNRIWPGSGMAPSAEGAMAAGIMEEMARRSVFASVDVHNNTGTNPHYACVNRMGSRFLRLATLFGRMVIHFTRPLGTQASAFAACCPAVTLECGKPGQPYGAEHALQFLDACLHLVDLPDHPVAAHDIDLFNSVAQVRVRDDATFGFDSTAFDLRLPQRMDHWNFTEIPAGSTWGGLRTGLDRCPVVVRDESGGDVTHEYFRLEGDRLVLRKAVMPSMLTLDERVIRQDCLCYLMERVVPATGEI